LKAEVGVAVVDVSAGATGAVSESTNTAMDMACADPSGFPR
jgi:hypothetical protein